jgi:hypothetical protein
MPGSDKYDSPGPVGLRVDEPSGLGRYVPIVHWLPRYQRTWLRADAIAGLTLWGLVVPEGMAYAGIAGLPPQAGLYTLVASLLAYALLGPRPIPRPTRPMRPASCSSPVRCSSWPASPSWASSRSSSPSR